LWLEKEFKIRIFDNSRHLVLPTVKGIDLINQAKKILGEGTFIRIASQKNKPEGEFRLGILPGFAPYFQNDHFCNFCGFEKIELQGEPVKELLPLLQMK